MLKDERRSQTRFCSRLQVAGKGWQSERPLQRRASSEDKTFRRAVVRPRSYYQTISAEARKGKLDQPASET